MSILPSIMRLFLVLMAISTATLVPSTSLLFPI